MAKKSKTSKCVICGDPVHGYGHNAEPVASGRCCAICNDIYVIPMRLGYLYGKPPATNEETR